MSHLLFKMVSSDSSDLSLQISFLELPSMSRCLSYCLVVCFLTKKAIPFKVKETRGLNTEVKNVVFLNYSSSKTDLECLVENGLEIASAIKFLKCKEVVNNFLK